MRRSLEASVATEGRLSFGASARPIRDTQAERIRGNRAVAPPHRTMLTPTGRVTEEVAARPPPVGSTSSGGQPSRQLVLESVFPPEFDILLGDLLKQVANLFEEVVAES